MPVSNPVRYPLAFTVAGTGRFPFDMLRYDGAYPNAPQDAAAIGLDCSELRARDSRRTVRLLTNIRTRPTFGRWSSFGWAVISHDNVTGIELDEDELAERIAAITARPTTPTNTVEPFEC